MASEQLQMIVEMLRGAQFLEGTSIPQMREGMEMLVAQAMLPEGTRCEKTVAGGVPAEWITNTDAQRGVLLYLHGGGYCLGSINTHRPLVSNLSKACRLRGLAIEYRLAPEHPFPAAVDDATAAYRWL